MAERSYLSGIIPAVVTPLTDDDRPALDNLGRHIKVLAGEGCSGVMLLGTTGEGPSLGVGEREAIIEAGITAAGRMRVMVGTMSSSLADATLMTRRAFDLGAHAVVVVPPFYYKKVSDDGLFAFYCRLLDEAVPDRHFLLLYHIPQVTGVPISFDLIERLAIYGGDRVGGLKDSSGDFGHVRELCARFPQMNVFVGSDKMLLDGLHEGAAGCITAGANVLAPLDVAVYRAFEAGADAAPLQSRLSAAREILDAHQPLAPTLKALLQLRYGCPGWNVRPPLVPLSERERQDVVTALGATGSAEELGWLGR